MGLTSIQQKVLDVAPFTGAWIEIHIISFDDLGGVVAPFTGAWIEICHLLWRVMLGFGRSLHGGVD